MTEDASEVAIVLTTFEAGTAAAIARTLVEERLVACVNILPPMNSIYRWQGKIEEDMEEQVMLKTTTDRVPAVAARLQALHPYKLPELLVINVNAGSEAYLRWIQDETRPVP